MSDLYTHLNKKLTSIYQVITCGEIIHAFVRELRAKGTALYDNLSVIPVNTIEEMTTRVKSYIDLEIANEGRKPHKESKKEIHEGKWSEQCPRKNGNEDPKCRPIIPHPSREVYETFTPVN